MKKTLTESQRLERNAYRRKYYAEHKDPSKSGRLKSSYPFDRHRWKRIKSRLNRLIEEYSWSEVEQVVGVVKTEHQTDYSETRTSLTEEV